MPTFTHTRLRSRDAALAHRIKLLAEALQKATAANGDLTRELEQLRAQNRALRAALDERWSADRQRRPLPEMTAGTSIGPRHPRNVTAG